MSISDKIHMSFQESISKAHSPYSIFLCPEPFPKGHGSSVQCTHAARPGHITTATASFPVTLSVTLPV